MKKRKNWRSVLPTHESKCTLLIARYLEENSSFDHYWTKRVEMKNVWLSVLPTVNFESKLFRSQCCQLFEKAFKVWEKVSNVIQINCNYMYWWRHCGLIHSWQHWNSISVANIDLSVLYIAISMNFSISKHIFI